MKWLQIDHWTRIVDTFNFSERDHQVDHQNLFAKNDITFLIKWPLDRPLD